MIFIKIKKVVFSWIKKEKDLIDFQNMKRLDVTFEEGKDYPVIFIDAGDVKIQDSSLKIDSKEILEKIGKIDFEAIDTSEFSGDEWELFINDKLYKGVLSEPGYVLKVKKIIRFNAILVYANKKLAGYVKA